MEGVGFEVESGVGFKDDKPFVSIEFGEEKRQVRPDKAREMGMMLIESAVEAERDAALVIGLSEVGFDTKDSAGILYLMRQHRPEVEGE